jgi:hypothetical protein
VTVAAFIVRALNLDTVRWLVTVVILHAPITMLMAASSDRTPSAVAHEGPAAYFWAIPRSLPRPRRSGARRTRRTPRIVREALPARLLPHNHLGLVAEYLRSVFGDRSHGGLAMRPRRRPVVGFAAVVAVCVVALAGDTVFAGQGCVTGFDPPEVVIPALGPVVMSATFAVLTASNDCQWTYERTQLPDGTLVSGFLWLGSPSRTSGTGPASVTFVVAPNESPQPRSLTLFFDGRAVPITQEGNRCYLTLSTPAPSSFPATGGTGSFTVDTGGSPCSYQAAVGSGVTILSGSSGSSFPATVTFSVPPNHTREPAYHFMTVLPNPGPSAPYMLLVTQDANPCPLAFSGVTPVTIPANGGTGSFTVNSSGSSCSYAAQGGDGVTIVSGGSGNTFPATVRFAVGPNTSENPSNRYVSVSSLGTFAFAPAVTIVQNGSPVATDAPPGDFIFATHRSPTSAEYMSPPEPLRITNTEDPTASWIATASEPWLVVSPSSGASPARPRSR